MLIKAERTGRKTFGDRKDDVTKTVTVEGVKMTLEVADTWSSGEYPGDGEYVRCTWLRGPRVDPYPNIKDLK